MNRKGKIERAWWKKEGEEIVKINGCTLSGYFSQFAVFGRKKKCLTEMVLLGGRDVFENPAGYTDKQEIT